MFCFLRLVQAATWLMAIHSLASSGSKTLLSFKQFPNVSCEKSCDLLQVSSYFCICSFFFYFLLSFSDIVISSDSSPRRLMVGRIGKDVEGSGPCIWSDV